MMTLNRLDKSGKSRTEQEQEDTDPKNPMFIVTMRETDSDWVVAYVPAKTWYISQEYLSESLHHTEAGYAVGATVNMMNPAKCVKV